jgi:cytochrome c peroxidase
VGGLGGLPRAGILSEQEIAGLRLFIGEGQCINCHNGPLLTDNHFHNTGVPAVPDLPEDSGRADGARLVLEDEFNCLGPYSDAEPEDCDELRFMSAEGHELLRAFKTPSLRGAATRPPYMHAGQIETLEEVLDHYASAPEAPAGHSELRPLELTEEERAQLVAFLATIIQARRIKDKSWRRAHCRMDCKLGYNQPGVVILALRLLFRHPPGSSSGPTR